MGIKTYFCENNFISISYLNHSIKKKMRNIIFCFILILSVSCIKEKEVEQIKSNVYCVGAKSKNTNTWLPMYCFNDSIISFNDSTKRFFQVFVVDNDIYFCGIEGNFAKYWKNGIGYNLTNGSRYASAASIYVDKQNVYVVGFEYDENGNSIAILEKWH